MFMLIHRIRFFVFCCFSFLPFAICRHSELVVSTQAPASNQNFAVEKPAQCIHGNVPEGLQNLLGYLLLADLWILSECGSGDSGGRGQLGVKV